MPELPPIVQVGDVLLSSEVFTECFCCDLSACRGQCCVEGDSGAPLQPDEVMELENVCNAVWPDLSAAAQDVIDRQGVAYTDCEGDLVTSIVNGRDCVFTCYNDEGCCLCATDKAFREGRTTWCKPISCALYPLRESQLKNGLTALRYHRWNVCRPAVQKGRSLQLPFYCYLVEFFMCCFGAAWYEELCAVAEQLLAE